MSIFPPAPDPQSPLARHRILAPTAGVKVSPLCLGAMNFGDAWQQMMGKCDKDQTFDILDHFYEAGGNFIDTANNYQEQESEQWIGEWLEKRGVRDQMVIATKYTTYFKRSEGVKQASSFVGNSAKSLHTSVRASLKKLRTDYIDVLYLHWWDFSTSVEEVMQSLNRLVQNGSVLYLGVSDTPAWIVSKANQYARDHGLAQFVVYQGLWNAAKRDLEREILPMCQAEGMAIAPWQALGGGKFKTEEHHANDTEGRKPIFGGPTEAEKNMVKVLHGIAQKRDTLITSIALAYVMNTTPDVYPIVGGRNVNHLKGNIEALKIKLTAEELDEIRKASNFDTGFPLSMITPQQNNPAEAKVTDTFLTKHALVMDVPTKRQPAFPPDAK